MPLKGFVVLKQAFKRMEKCTVVPVHDGAIHLHAGNTPFDPKKSFIIKYRHVYLGVSLYR
jgi:hypothetical protein